MMVEQQECTPSPSLSVVCCRAEAGAGSAHQRQSKRPFDFGASLSAHPFRRRASQDLELPTLQLRQCLNERQAAHACILSGKTTFAHLGGTSRRPQLSGCCSLPLVCHLHALGITAAIVLCTTCESTELP
jgi:hypothetical protein